MTRPTLHSPYSQNNGSRLTLPTVLVTGGLGYIGSHTDRKSTRLNSSHSQIPYAVFCLKKKTLGRAHADAVGRAGRGTQRAADSLLEPVLVPVQHVPPPAARVDGALELRVLLRARPPAD